MRGVRWAVALLAVASIAAGAGSSMSSRCEDSFVILPDGCGRIALSVSEPAKAKPERAANVLDWVDEVAETSHGVAAITDDRRTTAGGWVTSSLTVWFDDANAVQLFEGRHDPVAETRLAWNRDGDGYRLELTGGTVFGAARQVVDAFARVAAFPGSEQEIARRRADGLARSKDLEAKTEIHLPGPVLAAEGLETADPRTVVAWLSGAKPELDKRAAKCAGLPSFTVRCGPSSMTAEESEKFKAELARAKDTWHRDPRSSEVIGKVRSPIWTAKGEIQAWDSAPSAARFCCMSSSGKASVRVRADVFDASGKAVGSFVLPGCDKEPDRVFLTEDGREVIALAEITEFLGAYDAATGRCLWKRDPDDADDSDDVGVEWAAAYLRGGLVAHVRHGTGVEILDAATGAVRRSFREAKAVRAVCAAPGTGRLVLAEGSTLTLVDAVTGKRVWSIEAPCRKEFDGWFWLVAGAAGGPILATRSDADASVMEAIDPATGKTLWSDSNRSIDSVSSSGRIGTEFGRRVYVYDLATGRTLTRIALSERLQTGEGLQISGDEKTFFVRTKDQRIVPVQLDAAPAAPK